MSSSKKIVIATRASKLALWQAEYVRNNLLMFYPEYSIELLTIITKGDRFLDTPLSKVGGKGLFVKEIEKSLLDGVADLAVHSMKDVPADIQDDLEICSIMHREDPRDAFVSNICFSIDELMPGSVIGTSSLRRESQIKNVFPKLIVKSLRGNLDTRLDKLDSGYYDAIILASAGLKRIGYDTRIKQYIDTEVILPAVAQGALGLQIRSDRDDIRTLLSVLSCSDTTACVSAERSFLRMLGGSCQFPIAAYGSLIGNNLLLKALVASLDGGNIIKSEISGPINIAVDLGKNLAQEILSKGGDKILNSLSF
ncbi:MAG: hydroxymethylbilane synthase [Candidatus Kinetoplastibacterium crithidii]|nr:MAG: hydroxymethylbilane synthase [Candidatus Kinetoplastibacterium crithidii]